MVASIYIKKIIYDYLISDMKLVFLSIKSLFLATGYCFILDFGVIFIHNVKK